MAFWRLSLCMAEQAAVWQSSRLRSSRRVLLVAVLIFARAITEGMELPLTSALFVAMPRKVMKVKTPSTMHRPHTMPKAAVNLRETGRLRSHCMAVTLSDATQGFHRRNRVGLEYFRSEGSSEAA